MLFPVKPIVGFDHSVFTDLIKNTESDQRVWIVNIRSDKTSLIIFVDKKERLLVVHVLWKPLNLHEIFKKSSRDFTRLAEVSIRIFYTAKTEI